MMVYIKDTILRDLKMNVLGGKAISLYQMILKASTTFGMVMISRIRTSLRQEPGLLSHNGHTCFLEFVLMDVVSQVIQSFDRLTQ